MFAKYLYNWDSVQFALALEHFSVADHTPHPPGYPLFVLTGKLFQYFLPDANAAFIATSFLFALGTLILFYFLARQFFSRRQALALTLLYLSCPVLLGNSLVALSYTAEGFFGLALAFLGWLVIKSARAQNQLWPVWLLLSAAVSSLALGYREGVLVYFLPLYVYALYCLVRHLKAKTSTKMVYLTCWVAIFLLLTAVWYFPFLKLAGGWAVYHQAVSLQSRIVIWPNTLWGGGLTAFWLNIQVLLVVLFYGFPLGWVVLLFFLAKKEAFKASWWKSSGRFFWLWILPALIFLATIYIRRSGYVLVILPAFYLLLGWAWRKFMPVQRLGLWLILFLANLYFFFWIPQAPLSYGEIRRHDRMTADRISLVRENFRPDDTLVLASDDFNNGWRQAMYYLSEYHVVRHGWLAKEHMVGIPKLYYLASLDHPCYRIQEGYEHRSRYLNALTVPPQVKNVVIWDKNMADFCLAQKTLKTMTTSVSGQPEIWAVPVRGRSTQIILIPPYYFIFQTKPDVHKN